MMQPHHTLYLARHPLLAGLTATAVISFVLMTVYCYTKWLAIILHGSAAFVVACICTAVPVLKIGIELARDHSMRIRTSYIQKFKDEQADKKRLLEKKKNE